MSCEAKHPQHGVPCEGEAGHFGRHHSTWPYREWGEWVEAPGPARAPFVLRASREGNAKAEGESAARYAWERGEDVTEGWRPDGGRTWRWL